jgi:hypothetical protein
MRQSLIRGICLMESSRIPADNDMLETQTCPVCGMENISWDADRCPQCDADMTCFKVLDTLPDEIKPRGEDEIKPSPAAAEAVRSGQFSKMRSFMPAVMMLLMGLIILLTLFQFYRFRKLETMVANQKTELTKSLHGLMNEVRETGTGTTDSSFSETRQKTDSEAKFVTPTGESLVGNAQTEPDKAKTEVSQPATAPKETPPPKPEPLPESEFWTYNAGEGDTLWDIAEMYYGSGHYYPVLLEHNPNICVYEIGYGVRLKILRNPRVARQIYRKIIVKEKDHLYWYYTIVEGDTFRSVINKFYRIKDVEKLSEENPDAELQSGKRIKILLQ